MIVRASKYLTMILAIASMTVLMSGLAVAKPASGGHSADKATGSGTWTNGGGVDFYAQFNAHEAAGNRDAKGYLFQNRLDGDGGFTVDVDTVNVYATYACFGGVTTSGWGEYANRVGSYRWTVVVDGGEPGEDFLRGGWTGTPSFCDPADTAGNQSFSSGNVQVHAGD
jgi:hypothetical protein